MKVGPSTTGISALARRTSSIAGLFAHSKPLSTHAFLSSWAFACVWVAIVGVHLANGMVQIVRGIVYVMMSQPVNYSAITMIQIPPEMLQVSGWCMIALAIIHFTMGVSIISSSIRSRQLTFVGPPRPPPPPPKRSKSSAIVRQQRSQCLQWLYRGPLSILAVSGMLFERVFGVDGYVGVNGPFFFVFFNILEGVEVMTQSYQAYQLSRSVRSEWLNAFVAAIVLLNGWLPWLVHLVLRKKPGTERLVVVTVDLMLDFIYAELIPALIILPVMADYDLAKRAFPPALSFDDVWAYQAVAQTRFVLIATYLDLAVTLVPYLNFIVGLHTLKTLLHDRSHATDTSLPPSRQGSHGLQHHHGQKKATFRRRQKLLARFWSRLFHIAMCVWSAGVVLFHILAQTHTHEMDGCLLHLRPWKLRDSEQVPCAVMYVNCHRLHITGVASEIDSVLTSLQPQLLSKLVFAHCASLEMPSLLTQLTELSSIDTFNSTVSRWDADAAITRSHHPSFHHVFLFDTNLTIGLPAGIVHDQLPHGMQYLAIYNSNLSTLPDTIGDKWGRPILSQSKPPPPPHVFEVIALINTNVAALPASFQQLSVRVLMLQGNPLTQLGDDFFHTMECCERVRISGKAFTTLPSLVDDTSPISQRLRRLTIEDTSVASLPQWVSDWLVKEDLRQRRHVSFHGSTLCEQAEYTAQCGPDDAFDVNAYPYEIIAAQRPL